MFSKKSKTLNSKGSLKKNNLVSLSPCVTNDMSSTVVRIMDKNASCEELFATK